MLSTTNGPRQAYTQPLASVTEDAVAFVTPSSAMLWRPGREFAVSRSNSVAAARAAASLGNRMIEIVMNFRLCRSPLDRVVSAPPMRWLRSAIGA
ncbi:hypothetical protein ACIHDR_35810 [Nocardia sp. NPDC052278]|uniref:hypothetical protein n=1 Tax=Nocardia sp. NPDC052278 TaxID=3364328 RepID=UPI0037CB073D